MRELIRDKGELRVTDIIKSGTLLCNNNYILGELDEANNSRENPPKKKADVITFLSIL